MGNVPSKRSPERLGDALGTPGVGSRLSADVLGMLVPWDRSLEEMRQVAPSGGQEDPDCFSTWCLKQARKRAI